MLGDVLKPGDLIQVSIPKESREWGFNPCPDGTIAKVVGFSTITHGRIGNFGREPGVYLNHCWPEIQFSDGKTLHISCCHIEPVDAPLLELDDLDKAYLTTNYFANTTVVDKEVYEQRCADLRNQPDVKVKVGELPETEFYEGDVVTSSYIRFDRSFPNGRAVISRVKYENIGKLCADNTTPMPLYEISDKLGSGWASLVKSADIAEFTLVERGPVWKFYHNEPIEWASVEEEANFFKMLGRTAEVRNPATDLYSFTKEQAVAALASGIGDAITVGSMFGSAPITSVWKFNDPVLGAKVRALTLKGFGVA